LTLVSTKKSTLERFTNNSVTSEPGDPGVPYAIGNKFGGHKPVEPELGTLDDFDWQFVWRGVRNFVMLDPHSRPAHVFRLRRLIRMYVERASPPAHSTGNGRGRPFYIMASR
jgi:hypothetical protein